MQDFWDDDFVSDSCKIFSRLQDLAWGWQDLMSDFLTWDYSNDLVYLYYGYEEFCCFFYYFMNKLNVSRGEMNKNSYKFIDKRSAWSVFLVTKKDKTESVNFFRTRQTQNFRTRTRRSLLERPAWRTKWKPCINFLENWINTKFVYFVLGW